MTIINHNQFRRFSFQCIEVVSYSPVKQSNIVTLVKTGHFNFCVNLLFLTTFGSNKISAQNTGDIKPFHTISEISVTIYKCFVGTDEALTF